MITPIAFYNKTFSQGPAYPDLLLLGSINQTNIQLRARHFLVDNSGREIRGWYEKGLNKEVLGSTPNNNISAAISDPNSTIYAVGNFTSPTGRIFSLLANGPINPTFSVGSGFNNSVNDIARQSTGKLICVGNFISFSGSTITRVARINPTGVFDPTFYNSAPSADCPNVVVLPNDSIVFTHTGTNVDGVSDRTGVIKLSPNGTFSNILYPSATWSIGFNTLHYISNGNIALGGSFVAAADTGKSRFLVFDSNLDPVYEPGTNIPNNTVNTIVSNPSNQLFIGGAFTAWGGTAAGRIWSYNSDFTINTTFSSNTTPGFNNTISKIIYTNDDKLLVLGSFTAFNGNTLPLALRKVCRLNIDGTLDTSFSLEGQGMMQAVINGGLQLPNSNFLITFTTAVSPVLGNETSATGSNYIQVLKDNLFSDFSNTRGFNEATSQVVKQTDGKYIFVGSFTTYGTFSANRIIRLNSDYSIDTSYYTTIGSERTTGATAFSGEVLTIGKMSDGSVICAGLFSQYNGKTRGNIVRINADGTENTAWQTNVGTTGFNNRVRVVAIQSDDKCIVGGDFDRFRGSSNRNRLIRLNADGTYDSTFYTGGVRGVNNSVRVIKILSDGKILVGGSFTQISPASSPITKNGIILLNSDGTEHTSFYSNTNGGIRSGVFSIDFQSTGKLIIGGNIIQFNGGSTLTGNNSWNVVRYNPDGTCDTTFQTATYSAFGTNAAGVFVYPDDKILVVSQGEFRTRGDGWRRNILRLNADGSEDLTFQTEDLTYRLPQRPTFLNTITQVFQL
jgi:uncharacterized delta-60 repeat protein